MSITHIGVLSIPVTDQDRALAFYRDVLGMELVRDNPMGHAGRWVQVRPVGAQTTITLVTWFESMPAGSLTGLVLETDDLDAEVARLRSLGADMDEVVRNQAWGASAVIRDPDRNHLVIQHTTAA
jgi:catechol 2,3-dioxygenase-like lactoylglutathione lyase family enzyme